MPSQLLRNDRIGFICCRTFVYGGEQYTIGDEFPGERANNIETLVRARYVIPVVEKLEDKPRHWHLHVKLRSDVEERLARGPVTQIVFENEPDDEDQVGLEKLTHPEPEEPNQADHMSAVAEARIQREREAEAEREPEPEEEETEPEQKTDPYVPFSSNEEQLQFHEREETEPPEPPDPVAESTVPVPSEEPVEDEPEEPGSAEDEPSSEAPRGTIAQVKAWVGDDPDRAQTALDAEKTGQKRPRLILWLNQRVE